VYLGQIIAHLPNQTKLSVEVSELPKKKMREKKGDFGEKKLDSLFFLSTITKHEINPFKCLKLIKS